MGLSTRESWSLTPRELEALKKIRDAAHMDELRRWAFERADYRNVNFRGPGHTQAWTLDDFIGGAKPAQEAGSLEAEQARITRLSAEFRSGIASPLPAWAEMTTEEKQRKANREKNLGR